jgi:hypothetical protein
MRIVQPPIDKSKSRPPARNPSAAAILAAASYGRPRSSYANPARAFHLRQELATADALAVIEREEQAVSAELQGSGGSA